MKRVRPNLLVLAELELWPNLIRAAKKQGARVAVVNGRLSDRSLRGYRRVRPFFARLLQSLDAIAAQNAEYASRFCELGAPPDRVHLTGSIKFDGAQTDRDNPKTQQLAKLAGIPPGDIVFLAGSTQEPEEELALQVYRELAAEYPALRFIVTPRHPERFEEVAALLDRSQVRWQRRSRLEEGGLDPQARVLLVDAIGELGAVGHRADRVRRRQHGHAGRPKHDRACGLRRGRLVRPEHQQFPRCGGPAAGPRRRRGRYQPRGTGRLRPPLPGRSPFRAELGQRARQLVQEQAGAADKTCQLLQSLMT